MSKTLFTKILEILDSRRRKTDIDQKSNNFNKVRFFTKQPVRPYIQYIKE